MSLFLLRKYQSFLLLSLSVLFFGCEQAEVEPDKPLTRAEEQLLLGNPSGATPDPANENNYLISRAQYALSYSRERSTPNWVSWHVSSDWLGSVSRQDNFRADVTLPEGWNQVTSSNYTGSGFDRGHNTPSADRTNTAEDNAATFIMSNIIPQAPDHNQETWANLENYTRDLVRGGMEVYVIMGSYGQGGTGSKGYFLTIDNGRITVPRRIWKVLVILRQGNQDLARISSSTRVIAVDTPNSNSVQTDWRTYLTSVDAIEKATGYDLLSTLPVSVQNIIEAKVDSGSVAL